MSSGFRDRYQREFLEGDDCGCKTAFPESCSPCPCGLDDSQNKRKSSEPQGLGLQTPSWEMSFCTRRLLLTEGFEAKCRVCGSWDMRIFSRSPIVPVFRSIEDSRDSDGKWSF